MIKKSTFIIFAAIGLGACSSFGDEGENSTSSPATLATLAPARGYVDFVDTRSLASNLVGFNLSRTHSGAVLTATTIFPKNDNFDGQLFPITQDDKSKIIFEYRVNDPAPTSSAPTIQKTVAYTLSNSQLRNITEIVIRTEDKNYSLPL